MESLIHDCQFDRCSFRSRVVKFSTCTHRTSRCSRNQQRTTMTRHRFLHQWVERSDLREATSTFTDSSISTAFAASCACVAKLDFYNRPSFRFLQSIMIVRRLVDFTAINLAATTVAVSRTLFLHLGITTCGAFVVFSGLARLKVARFAMIAPMTPLITGSLLDRYTFTSM